MIPGAKSTGSALGLAGGVWLSDEVTTVTKQLLGFQVDPVALETAATTLINAASGGIITLGGLIGALVVGYYVRRAQARWGNGQEPVPAPTPPTQ